MNAKRFMTTHVGSLPGPADVWQQRDVSERRLSAAVKEVVAKQMVIPRSLGPQSRSIKRLSHTLKIESADSSKGRCEQRNGRTAFRTGGVNG